MGDTTKKLEIDDLPARAKVLDESEAAEVFGGAKAVKRGGKRRPPKRGKGKKVPKKRGKAKKPPRGKKRPKIGGGKKRL